MTNRELEQRLKDAVSHATPDLKAEILAACEKGKVIPMTQAEVKTKKRGFIPWIAAGAAACVAAVCLTVGIGVFGGGGPDFIDPIVTLDVNPSISLEVDEKERVVQADALNADAQTIMGSMELEGVQLDVAVNALIGSMLKNGYLSDAQNAILVSLQNGDQELQDKVTGYVGGALGNGSYAILSQMVTGDETLSSMASQYGISLGKASLIREMTAQDATLTAQTLAPLSVGEITLIANSRGLSLNGLVQSGETSMVSYISEEEAKAAAFAHAGVQESDASYVGVRFDTEDGLIVYEVKFFAGTTEYEYDINASTGAIVKVEKEIKNQAGQNTGSSSAPTTPDSSGSAGTDSNSGGSAGGTTGTTSKPTTPPQGNSGSGRISEAEAKAAALKHAGVSESSVTGYWVELDYDDGRVKYELEFYVGSTEYDYDIDAATGAVLKAEQTQHNGYGGSQQGSSTISEAEAKTAALNHAGVSAGSVSGYRSKLDYDDGLRRYEIEFYAGGVEYEYEIDASSGAVLKAERSQKAVQGGSNTVSVSEAQAKAAALKHAGVSEGEISRYKVELDREDGRMVYEIEFNVGWMEYEYEIDASNGSVLKADMDWDD